MEYTQWVVFAHVERGEVRIVLILVVMEYTQWEYFGITVTESIESLNPCCNGIYSMSYRGRSRRTLWKES